MEGHERPTGPGIWVRFPLRLGPPLLFAVAPASQHRSPGLPPCPLELHYSGNGGLHSAHSTIGRRALSGYGYGQAGGPCGSRVPPPDESAKRVWMLRRPSMAPGLMLAPNLSSARHRPELFLESNKRPRHVAHAHTEQRTEVGRR